MSAKVHVGQRVFLKGAGASNTTGTIKNVENTEFGSVIKIEVDEIGGYWTKKNMTAFRVDEVKSPYVGIGVYTLDSYNRMRKKWFIENYGVEAEKRVQYLK